MDTNAFVSKHASQRKRAMVDFAVITTLFLILFFFVGLPIPSVPGAALLFLLFRLGMVAQRLLTASSALNVCKTSTIDNNPTSPDLPI